MMKKRIFSFVMSLIMVLSLLPMQVLAAAVNYNPNSRYNTTITVRDEEGKAITGATVTVTRGNNTYTVSETSTGRYKFTRDGTKWWNTYEITVSKDGYEPETVSINGNVGTVAVTLYEVVEEWQTFDVYYLVAGLPEKGYAAPGDEENYGPSGNNTPMATINVNLTELRALANDAERGVLYLEGNSATGNEYEFVPKGNVTDENRIEKISNFWNDVKSCMDAESIAAIEATGLGDNFMLYCLKKQNDNSYHADGVLYVPPNIAEEMFVVELYEKYSGDSEFSYFWGAVVNGTVTESGIVPEEEIKKIPSMYALLDQYELHLNQNITWNENDNGTPKLENGYYSGTYIDNGRLYNIQITQIAVDGQRLDDWDKDGTKEENEEYPFYVQGKGYNVARFEMTVVDKGPVEYVVTYTDGVDGEEIFYDHEYSVTQGDHPQPFHSDPVREGYTFLGWVLEGDPTGTVRPSTGENGVTSLIVNQDMTFYAVWKLIPKYTGTVEVILDGSYNSTEGTAEGTHKDISDILKLQAADIYVSADGVNYIRLNHTAVGVYSAVLENGTYSIYYSTDGGNTLTQLSEQNLVMQNENRTRYLFYNSVTYAPNGGTLNVSDAQYVDQYVEYYYSGKDVNVYGTEPVREGYVFLGWQEGGYQKLYQPEEQLTGNIERAYTLTAQWEKAADVYVTVVIKHTPESGGVNNVSGMHDIAFTVDGRSGNSGDYSEMYRHEINWDGKSEYTDAGYTYEFYESVTKYTSTTPALSNVPADWDYKATAAKTGYEIVSNETETDAAGNKHITLTLVFYPNNRDLTFRVELDEEARELDPKVWPKAVNVKVNCWYDAPDDGVEIVDWNVITQHVEVYQRVELGNDGVGNDGVGIGTYPVWATFSAEENGQQLQKPYYYRVEVVSFELQDGTIVPAHDASDTSKHPSDAAPHAHVSYHAEKHLYNAEVEIRGGGADPDGNAEGGTSLTGAYFDENSAQSGTPTVIVSIPIYTVWIDPMGGTLNGEAFIEKTNQIFVPDMSRQIPVRDDGYVFHEWAWKKVTFTGGLIPNFVLIPALQAGDYLTHDLYLEAQWLPPITVEGLVTVDATYRQDDGYQEIHEVDRAKTVIVLLQRDRGNGYYETIRDEKVTLKYGQDAYDEADGREVGYAEYQFTNVPQDGSYRITVLAPNYTALYQNEPQSLTSKNVYSTYTPGMFTALLGDEEKTIATVNAHLEFEPPSFDLKYEVDATQIGAGFRPSGAEVLVTYDNGDVAVTNPADWAVISQMVFKQAPTLRGDEVDLPASGIKGSSYSVWKTSSDGASLYDYGIQVYDLEGESWYNDYEHGTENPRFAIIYQSPAHFDIQTGAQNRKLVATLVPRTYSITYELDGGTFGTDKYPTSHTWSYETLFGVTPPTRNGYEFEGWEIQVGNGKPAAWDGEAIPADIAGDIIFYAKWSRVVVNLKVVIGHVPEHGGKAANYDKILTAKLASRLNDADGDFQQMDGYVKNYDDTDWHTSWDGADFDVFKAPMIYTTRDGLSDTFDYNMIVSMDGYGVVDSLTVPADAYSGEQEEPETSEGDDSAGEDGSAEVHTAKTGVTKTTSVTSGGTTEIVHDVVVCLQYNPDLLTLAFSVEIDGDDVERWRWPAYANVKVTCWYDPEGGEEDWQIITQHEESVVKVSIDPNGNGTGTGQYPVWQWLNESGEDTLTEQPVPFYYRMEVASMVLQDGTVVEFQEKTDEVLYTAPGYTVTVMADEDCGRPQDFDGSIAEGTALTGAYGKPTENGEYEQQGTLKAVIDMGKVVFHANNDEWNGDGDGDPKTDVFRTYYPAAEEKLLPEGENYVMSDNGIIETFYDIPEFEYSVHNKYIFKGWYTHPTKQETDDTAMEWGTEYLYEVADDVHLYAHWIKTGEVSKEEADKSTTEESYVGLELVGVQIRNAENDNLPHHGDAGSGLRFLASMSEAVHSELESLDEDFQYGFVVAREADVENFAKGSSDYEILYKDANVNGVDTTGTHYYVINQRCNGTDKNGDEIVDHYSGEAYRLFTVVVTYKKLQGTALADAQKTVFAARVYVRYYDANKLLRTYHSNYAGTNFYSGINMSYANAAKVYGSQATERYGGV